VHDEQSATTSGDIDVPKGGAEASKRPANVFCQTMRPSRESKAVRMPPMPSVKRRPSYTTGVDLGPLPYETAPG
jgi:hypothetical protein